MIRPEAMDGWKQAFLLAFGLHIALFMICLFYPGNRHKKVNVLSVYHVQLFEPAVKSSPAPSSARPKIVAPVRKAPKRRAATASPVSKKRHTEKQVKKTVKKEVKVARRPSKKAFSLKQKKVRKKKAEKTPARKKVATSKLRQKKRVNEEKELSRRIKNIEEKVREKEEEQLLSERLASIQKKVRSGSGSSKGIAPPRAAGAARGRAANDALRLYAGAIWSQVHKNWHLLEELKKKDLEAIVAIRVDKNGHIMSRRFEKRSGFSAFDRSVLKAVSDSDPLLPLPAQLRPGPLEIGIRFNPSRMDSQ